MGQPWMALQQGAGVSMGALLWDKVFKGPRSQESRKKCAVQLRRWEEEEGPRPYLLTQPGGTQHQGWAEASTQQGGQPWGVGYKTGSRKQSYRAKVRIKRKPPHLAPQRSMDEAVPTLEG